MVRSTAEALFFDPKRHFEALAIRVSELAERGEYAAAFRYADRRCRLSKPSAHDYLLRSEASRRSGFSEEAVSDLARALEIDPTDRLVLRVALNCGSSEQKSVAAALLAADEASDRMALRQAAGGTADLDPGEGAADVVVARKPERSEEPSTDAPREDAALLSVIVPVYEDYEATRACFEALFAQRDLLSTRIVVVDDASPNPTLRQWLDQQAAAGRFILLRNETNIGFAASVNRALALCPAGDVILLNADALPPPTSLSRLANVAHRSPEIGAVTPLSNNGEYTSFPAPNTVNSLGGPEAVERIDLLAEAVNGLDFVDLPNGIGFCLYITRACLDAVGSLPEIYARGYYEDVEFCLRARDKGFRSVCAVGVYVGHAGARSFRAEKRRLVMRNLAILERRFPGYQLESATFVKADPLRAARGAIEARVPNSNETILLICAGGASRLFAGERAKELAAREGPVPLVCACQGGVAELRGAERAWPQSLNYRLDQGPDFRALVDYLRATKIVRIELFDPLSMPVPLLRSLFQIGAEVELVGADLEWAVALRSASHGACSGPEGAGPCPSCASGAFSASGDNGIRSRQLKRKRTLLSQAKAIRPLDPMAEAVARHIFGDEFVLRAEEPDIVATPLGLRGAGGALAILSPLPDPLADRLVVALGRALLQRNEAARIVVLGSCVNDLVVMGPGNVFVAGAVESGEYVRLLRQYEVSVLMSPYRTRFFGWVDRLSRSFALPQAFFDFSFGKLAVAEPDLALDPRLCDAKSAALVADWFLARSARAAEQ